MTPCLIPRHNVQTVFDALYSKDFNKALFFHRFVIPLEHTLTIEDQACHQWNEHQLCKYGHKVFKRERYASALTFLKPTVTRALVNSAALTAIKFRPLAEYIFALKFEKKWDELREALPLILKKVTPDNCALSARTILFMHFVHCGYEDKTGDAMLECGVREKLFGRAEIIFAEDRLRLASICSLCITALIGKSPEDAFFFASQGFKLTAGCPDERSQALLKDFASLIG